jgi:hypothetical protein
VYFLEYTEIPEVFFMLHHGHWCQQSSEGITQWYQRQQWYLRSVLQRCALTMTLVRIVETVFQQWPHFTLFQHCASTMILHHGGCLVPRKNATDGWVHKVFFAYARAWRTRGKVVLLEFSEIPKVLFKPHHRPWHQQVFFDNHSLKELWTFSLFLKRNNNCNSGIQGHCCDSVIQDHCCESTMTSIPIVSAVCSNSHLG